MLRSAFSAVKSVGLVHETLFPLGFSQYHRILSGVLYRNRSSATTESSEPVNGTEVLDQNILDQKCKRIVEEKERLLKDKETLIKELEV